jgi:predicted alpha/beta hydrolase family esterase
MTDIIILPGIGGSGETHWQTHWERSNPHTRRFQPTSWDQPDLGDWIAALDRMVASARTPPLLVAHSLACLLVAHWQSISSLPVAGAFLVAVPDPTRAVFPAEAASFASVPEGRLRFPCLIVASTDDPYGEFQYAELRAAQWGSGIVEVGALGHINGSSGLGNWPRGLALLQAFAAGARPVTAEADSAATP